MLTINATVPCMSPPDWAVLERKLIDTMNSSVHPFLDKYTRKDGTLIWGTELSKFSPRDGADDFYESFYNWPLLYLMGGSEELLTLADQQWDAVTKQLTELGLVHNEYEKGYDWFHQGESYIYFYFLCMADPKNPKLIERAKRFAGLYLNEDPAVENYDSTLKLIRAPHTGSGGPRWGTGVPKYTPTKTMAKYGLPFSDVPGINTYDDLNDPENASTMGKIMEERQGRGDVIANLAATSLITNAYLLTGEKKYEEWVVEYVDAWISRATDNNGLLPDNVGLSGKVGEYTNDKWYGGMYGWEWPHGFYNIAKAAIVGATNAFLITKDSDYLNLPRTQVDHIMELGEVRNPDEEDMSLGEHWEHILNDTSNTAGTFIVPYRHSDNGWFDYQPMTPRYPTIIWHLSMHEDDWKRIETIRGKSNYDWTKVHSFHTKEDAHHEAPWLRFLAGENPDYPKSILKASYQQVCHRLDQIRSDTEDLTKVHIHHWQQLNPVTTEALIQLTLGAPQLIYNGGLLMSRLRYFDPNLERPGLPKDVAALVEKIEENRTVLKLINLSPIDSQDVIVQAGGFGEHLFKSAKYTALTSNYPGELGKGVPRVQTTIQSVPIMDKYLRIHIPQAMQITIDLEMDHFVNDPTYSLPWDNTT